MFEELEVKRSIMIRHVKVTNLLLYKYVGRTLMIVHSVFSVMAGLVVEMLFMLFSVYNTA